jgi:hypothetical protein
MMAEGVVAGVVRIGREEIGAIMGVHHHGAGYLVQIVEALEPMAIGPGPRQGRRDHRGQYSERGDYGYQFDQSKRSAVPGRRTGERRWRA